MLVLQEIEAALSNEFFKDVKRKFRRGSRRATLSSPKRKVSYSGVKRSPTYLAPSQKVKPSSRSSAAQFQPLHEKPDSFDNDDDSYEMNKDETDAAHETIIFDEEKDESKSYEKQKSHVSVGDDYIDINTRKQPVNSRVKFSDSTFDVRSDASDNQKSTQTLSATALDFELNVVVDIDSGKCTFYTGAHDVKEEVFSPGHR